jgi:hypothetical protein
MMTHFDHLKPQKVVSVPFMPEYLAPVRCSKTDPYFPSKRSTLRRSTSLSGVAPPRLFHSSHISMLLRYHS